MKRLIPFLIVILLLTACAPASTSPNEAALWQYSSPAESQNGNQNIDLAAGMDISQSLDLTEQAQAYNEYISPNEWADVGPVNQGIYFQDQETGRISLSTGGAPGLSAPGNGTFEYCLGGPGQGMAISMAPYDKETSVLVEAKIDERKIVDFVVYPDKSRFPEAGLYSYNDIGKVGVPRGSVSWPTLTMNLNPPVGNYGNSWRVVGWFDGTYGNRASYGTYALEIYYNVCRISVPGGTTYGLCAPPYCFTYEVR